MSNFKRMHLRARFYTEALYEDMNDALKAKIINISEGGVLLSELPKTPEINSLPMMFALPQLPRFQEMSLEQLRSFQINDLTHEVLKVKTKVVRNFQSRSAIDGVFFSSIGCQFVGLDLNGQELIREYVSQFAKNTIYLLSLFESLSNRKDQMETLKLVSKYMGYDFNQKIPLLRQKVLHDYQSLESL